MGLKEAVERYEKASKYIDNATEQEQEKWLQKYVEAVQDVRIAFEDHIKKELGYNPYTNYEELIQMLEKLETT